MSVPLIAIVGVCASGKSMLVAALRVRGFNARQVMQEHSYVPDMWRQITKPELLIYLDAGLATIRRRRQQPDWPAWILEREIERLRHARAHCDLYVKTDDLTPGEVLDRALALLVDW
ncbi:MAG: hypothetical protein CVU38_13425 [Chloroflexi bacterium HGW-Chloroflexi-1]|nr:MAG: hypothetical protein CVU38_13425 [Chloroflexi bacterium HGW-Chloroflexi-1]